MGKVISVRRLPFAISSMLFALLPLHRFHRIAGSGAVSLVKDSQKGDGKRYQPGNDEDPGIVEHLDAVGKGTQPAVDEVIGNRPCDYD